jgi:hypothetical protein
MILYVLSYTDEYALAVLRFTLDRKVVERFKGDPNQCAHELRVVPLTVPEGSTYQDLWIADFSILEIHYVST